MQNSTFQLQSPRDYQDFLATKRIITAYRSSIAPIGSRVRVRLAVQILRDEGNYGLRVSYPGATLMIRSEQVIAHPALGLLACELDATLVSHDGRVSYVVRVGQHDLRVHAQLVRAIA